MGYLLQNGGLGMAGDWIITGGRPLQGRVEVPAAKNSVLPLLAASLLCSGPVRLQNVPRLTDVEDCLALLRGVGCTAGWQGAELAVQGQPLRTDLAPEAAGRMRASILFCAPLLARLGRVSTVLPGGCRIGARPIDLHLAGLVQMGACPQLEGERLLLTAPAGLYGADITLRFPSVGATETLLLAAALAACLCACGEQQAADGGSLRLYCPADLSEQNKSAGGGDAVQGIAIPWADITAGDRGRQQQAQYIMELLLGGCTAEGFIAPIPVGTQLLSCTVTGGTVSVDMSSEYDQLIGIDRTIADYCITLSLMQLDGIYAVRLTVAGELPADRTSEVYTSEEVLLTSPDDVVRTVKVQLYFPDGGGTLVGEERRLTVYEGETVAQAVVKALTERPLDSYADLYPLLPEGFTALNASTEEGICYLNLPGSVAALLPEDAEAQNRMIQGLVDSLCSLEDVTQVQLMLDGEYQLMLGSVPISRPILPTGGVQPTAE